MRHSSSENDIELNTHWKAQGYNSKTVVVAFPGTLLKLYTEQVLWSATSFLWEKQAIGFWDWTRQGANDIYCRSKIPQGPHLIKAQICNTIWNRQPYRNKITSGARIGWCGPFSKSLFLPLPSMERCMASGEHHFPFPTQCGVHNMRKAYLKPPNFSVVKTYVRWLGWRCRMLGYGSWMAISGIVFEWLGESRIRV